MLTGREAPAGPRAGRRAVPHPHHRPRLQRLHLHRPGHRLHRCRPGRGHRGGGRAPCPARCTAAPPAGPSTCSTTSAPPTGPRRGSGTPSSGATASWGSATVSTRPTIPGRSSCASVARSLGGDLVDFAEQVERTTVEVLAELKPGRQLYTNVEFFAGVVHAHLRHPPGHVHPDLRLQPDHRLGHPRHGAGRRQPADPAGGPLRGPAAAPAGPGRP